MRESIPPTCHQLRRALDSIAVRTQAIGALMAEGDVTADAAGSQLENRARQTGLPVSVVARQLLAGDQVSGDGYPGGAAQFG